MTFTVLALDAARTSIGVATASRSLAVGATVPMIDPTVGAAASQAWTNPGLRSTLLTAVAGGASPADAVGRLAEWDSEPECRQVALLGFSGRAAAHTGRATSDWCGHRVHDGLVVIGNLIHGPEVLDAMVDALDRPAGPDALAAGLMRALGAGEAAGGDVRGRQSAAILVTRQGRALPDYDLRVDDDADPVTKLAELVRLRLASPAQDPGSALER